MKFRNLLIGILVLGFAGAAWGAAGDPVLESRAVGSSSISDNQVAVIDDASAASGEVALFTSDGLEGRSIGIADDNIVEIDGAGITTGLYPRFTANGIEGRDAGEVMGDLSGGAADTFSFNGQFLSFMYGVLNTNDPEVTIALGSITPVGWRHTVDTAADAATDDLDTITNTDDIERIVIHPVHDARSVVVKHNTGNIWLQGKADITLDDIEDGLLLFWDSTNSKWFDTSAGGSGTETDPIIKAVGTTQGDMIYWTAASTPVRLAKGDANQILVMNDGATAPGWEAQAGGGDVSGPATNTDLSVPQWDGANSKLLKDGRAIGIADTNLVPVDASLFSAIVDNDYGKFTASGIEGRSYSQVLGDLSGSASADFAMNTHKITGVTDPTADQDAATKKYVDDNGGGFTNGDTPLVIGDDTAEDIYLAFMGNATDFYIGLDDSADELVIGNGTTVGSSQTIGISPYNSLTVATTGSMGGWDGNAGIYVDYISSEALSVSENRYGLFVNLQSTDATVGVAADANIWALRGTVGTSGIWSRYDYHAVTGTAVARNSSVDTDRGCMGIAGSAYQYGYGVATNEFRAVNPAGSAAKASGMQAVLGIVDPGHVAWNSGSDAIYSAITAQNSGTYAARNGLRIVDIGGGFHWGIIFEGGTFDYGIDMEGDDGSPGAPCVIGTGGIVMDTTTAGSKIIYDGKATASDYSSFQSDTFEWRIGYTKEMSLSATGLAVTGNVTASGSCCADYVFEEDYDLMPLDELQAFIEREKQLPNMTINDTDKVDLVTSVQELLVKVEEQALYILQLNERVKGLEATTLKIDGSTYYDERVVN